MIVDLQVGMVEDLDGLLATAKKAGLDGVVLTDDQPRFAEVGAHAELAARHGVKLFSGARVATEHGVLLCLLPKPALLEEGWAESGEGGLFVAESVIDSIEDRGGVTVALRPYDREVARPMGDHIFSLHGLSACDVQNGRVSDNANNLALEAAANLEMPCVGASSASGAEGLGRTATLFRGPMESEADLVEAIRHGECWPVAFSDTAPRVEPARSEARGDRGDRGGRGRRGGRGEGRSDRGEGRGRGEGRSDRGEGRSDRGEARGDRGGEGRGGGERKARGGRGRRGGRSGERGGGGRGGDDRGNRGGRPRPQGPLPDDIGNRAPAERGPQLAEDIGNRRRDHLERLPREDIGNRLRPGEQPLWRAPTATPDYGDDDDTPGNR
jgi:hypothetical protein